MVSGALLSVCQISGDVELWERRERKGSVDAAPMGKPGAAVTCKEPPQMEAEPWSSGGDHPVLLLVSLPLHVGGPHPVVHLQCFQNSDFYIPDELRLQSSFCGGGCSWDTGTAKTHSTAKTLPNGGWRILFWFCSANKRAEGGGLKSHL